MLSHAWQCPGRARACTGVHGACTGVLRHARACKGVHGACTGVLRHAWGCKVGHGRVGPSRPLSYPPEGGIYRKTGADGRGSERRREDKEER